MAREKEYNITENNNRRHKLYNAWDIRAPKHGSRGDVHFFFEIQFRLLSIDQFLDLMGREFDEPFLMSASYNTFHSNYNG
mmetsp:Transcript_23460/g.49929  ORF Transcript_23460/g.49929 Transcript_23460/m.49929 type:complete len:80 (-) Transcript_23460:1301-1540(-)